METSSAGKAAPSGSRAGAIVVLGAKTLRDGRPSRAIERRVQTAVALYRAGVAPVLLLSGGGERAVPEAEVMRGLALAAGVPDMALLVEPRSRNTLENATETARLLADRGISAVILVTDRYHAPRARVLFRLVGLSVRAVRAPPASLQQEWPMWMLESVKFPNSVARALFQRARVRRS
ncbi:MAG: YdcF family protein [Dongiaceae bacterium]